MAIDVFLSVGRTTAEQETFVCAVEDFLRAAGLNPRTVGRTDFTAGQPLQRVQELMRQCAGAVILAYERLYVRDAVDRRGSDAEQPVRDCSLPTVWNQIEATMAYVLRLPLLVVVERGLREEGLLEQGYDWYVQRVPLDATALTTREFLGVFADWRQRVDSAHASRSAPAVA